MSTENHDPSQENIEHDLSDQLIEESMTPVEDTHISDVPSENKPKTVHIVCIGASAGGLEALEKFFTSMPVSNDFAFVVIQHLSPDHKSMMAELLGKHTQYPVQVAEDGQTVEKGNIYLIPPGKNMTIFHGKLLLTRQENRLNLPIDLFMTSLAQDQGRKAIGIILSGTGSDGTRGVRAIKESGGMIMIQSAESARFDGMPRSAAATGLADYILKADKMPAELMSFIGNPYITRVDRNNNAGDPGLSKILALVRNQTGIDFTFYKQNTIIRRVERRMAINQIKEVSQYVDLLEKDNSELRTLYREVLIGVTRFFRDIETWDIIKEKVFPEIFNNKDAIEEIRVWVAGCSTGEEAYTMAILLAEFIEENNYRNDYKVFATDIDREALDFAARGTYPESIAADASLERMSEFFIRHDDVYQVQPRIREKVVFASHNVIKDPPFGKIDIVTCRNLLIYLQPVLQKKVFNNFHYSLKQGGFLFLGSSESVGDYMSVFTNFDLKSKIYRHTGGNFSALELPFIGIPEVRTTTMGSISSNAGAMPTSPVANTKVDNLLSDLVENFLSPAILVNEHRAVLQLFGDLNDFLRLPSGRISLDIQKMARKEFSIPLSTAIQRATKEKKDIFYRNIYVEEGGKKYSTDLTVKYLEDGAGQKFLFIMFDKKGKPEKEEIDADTFNLQENAQKRIGDLENELQHSQENLQATIEELETSNEELQATNEELTASNEELQSTNEELQSVNEELITVNSEYQKKIEELQELNADMNNFLASTDIGTLFLDENLCIRKFTPPVTRQMNIIASDIGRPLEDLTLNMEYEDFITDIKESMNREAVKEIEVQSRKGHWFLVKIFPYKSAGQLVSGIVIAFVDINERKKAQLNRDHDHRLLTSLFDINPIATSIVDKNGELTYINKKAEELYQLDRDNDMKKKYQDFGIEFLDENGKELPVDQRPFKQLVEKGQVIEEKPYTLLLPDGTRKAVTITATAIKGEDSNIDGVLFKTQLKE